MKSPVAKPWLKMVRSLLLGPRHRQPLSSRRRSSARLFLEQLEHRLTPSSNINTIAGNGSYGYSGDGGPATSAKLYLPFGTAVDSSGNVYIADTHNDRIREVVASTGNIITVAGNGTVGYSRRQRSRDLGRDRLPLRRGRGLQRQHLHRRQLQQPHPRGGQGHGQHHHHRRQRHQRLQRRRRPRHLRRDRISPKAWPWTAAATSSSPTRATIASARS